MFFFSFYSTIVALYIYIHVYTQISFEHAISSGYETLFRKLVELDVENSLTLIDHRFYAHLLKFSSKYGTASNLKFLMEHQFIDSLITIDFCNELIHDSVMDGNPSTLKFLLSIPGVDAAHVDHVCLNSDCEDYDSGQYPITNLGIAMYFRHELIVLELIQRDEVLYDIIHAIMFDDWRKIIDHYFTRDRNEFLLRSLISHNDLQPVYKLIRENWYIYIKEKENLEWANSVIREMYDIIWRFERDQRDDAWISQGRWNLSSDDEDDEVRK